MGRLIVVAGVVVFLALAGFWIYQETRPPADRWVASAGQKRVIKFIGIIVFAIAILAIVNFLFAILDLL